jgi:hypothetical protein
MSKKRAVRATKKIRPKPRARSLKKAVPPPDDPLLRHQAEELAHGGDEDRQRALARAKAIEQARRMPASDPSDDAADQDER